MPKREVTYFGDFEADLESGELRKGGVKIVLQEKPFQLLSILLRREGKVVSREELRKELWRERVHLDFDHSLNIAAAKLRYALSDSSRNPKFVETVGSRGYRFIAPVTATRANSNGALSGDGREKEKTRLAVLPFENLSNTPDHHYFSDGMNEEIIAQLGHMYPRRLGVIAKSSTVKYKGTTKGAHQIGRELAVDYLLEGSVRYAGDRARITAKLVQTGDETNLWSETYECGFSNMLGSQCEVAEKIVRAVERELLSSQEVAVPRRSPSNENAYHAYLKGTHYKSKRTEEDLRKSIQYLQRAVQEDANYVLAWSALADAHSLLAWHGNGLPNIHFPQAKEAALKALEMDSTSAESHTSLAFVKYLYEWDWPAAEKLLRRAIELNASYAVAHLVYSYYLSSRGRHDEAISEGRLAQTLDPLSLPTIVGLATAYYFARKYDEAIEELHKALDLEPNFRWALMWLGIAYGQQSMFEEAVSALEKAKASIPNNPTVVAWLGETYARFHRIEEARELLDELCRLSKELYIPAFALALIHTGLCQEEEAFEWLEKAYDERSPFLAVFLKVDSRLDSLRSHPKYQDLIDRVGM